MSKPYQGVILDIDGTLIDSNDAHARAWVEALAEHGHSIPFEKVRRLVGMGGDHLIPTATGIPKESDEGKRIEQRRAAIFKQRYLPEIKAFPRTRELLQTIKRHGMNFAVATSAKQEELKPLLECAGALDLIQETTSSSEADKSKPDPDIVHAALAKLNADPSQVVMLGDTPYDIEAAGRAGVKVIALRCGGWPDRDLAGALAIYDDPADLLAHYDDSPLAG